MQTHFDALSAGDSGKLASVFIHEVGESLSDATLPEIIIENLDIEKISETEDTAEVTAEYDAEITINDKPTQAHAKVKFTRTKADGEWLISNAEEILIEVEATVLATATLHSFDRPSKVSVSFQGDFQPPKPTPIRVAAPLPPGTTATPLISTTPHPLTPTPVPLISLESNPEEVTLPDTGQAEIVLTLRVAPGVALGIYEVTVMPQVLEDSRAQGVGEGYGTGGATLMIKVKAPD